MVQIIWCNFNEVTGAPHVEDQRFTVKMAVMEDQRFAVKTVYDYLRTKGKPVPTGKPQVVGHKVDISGLAKAAFEAGGRAQVAFCPNLFTFLVQLIHIGNCFWCVIIPALSETLCICFLAFHNYSISLYCWEYIPRICCW